MIHFSTLPSSFFSSFWEMTTWRKLGITRKPIRQVRFCDSDRWELQLLSEIYRLNVWGKVFSLSQILNISPNLQIAIYLNPIDYGILRLSQLRGEGGGFLSRTPENNIKIIWLVWNLVHIINGIRLLRMRNFRKFAVLFLEIWRHKICLFTRERFIAFRCLPPELYLMMPKSLFYYQKWFFWPKIILTTYFSHF